jgi:hypothetical protein
MNGRLESRPSAGAMSLALSLVSEPSSIEP